MRGLSTRITAIIFTGIMVFTLTGCLFKERNGDGTAMSNSKNSNTPSIKQDIFSELRSCETLDDDALLQKCKENAENPSDCTSRYMTRRILIAGCQDYAIDAKKDVRLCEYYNNTMRDYCILSLADITENASLCSGVKNKTLQALCEEHS